MGGKSSEGGGAADFVGSFGTLTPYGAAAEGLNAISGLASGGPSNATGGTVNTGFAPVTIGGFLTRNDLPSWFVPAAVAVAAISVFALIRSK